MAEEVKEVEAQEQVQEEQPHEQETEQEPEQIIVSIGDEPAPEPEPVSHEKESSIIRMVRKRNRELEKEVREAKKKLEEITAPKEVQARKKPKLEDFDYDTEKYEAALIPWYETERAEKEKREKEEMEWNARLEAYQEAKASFKADDYDEAEATALEFLDQTQQGIIVHGANDPALLVYALGKNDAKAKELGAIKDPVKFAFAIAKLEAQLKVSTKKPATQPESKIIGNSRPSGSIDSTLERLREEASRTGDYSKVMEYKRKKR